MCRETECRDNRIQASPPPVSTPKYLKISLSRDVIPRRSTENLGGPRMINMRNAEGVRSSPTRRWVVATAGLVLGRMMAGAAFGGTFQKKMKEAQTTVADKTRTSLHQEIAFKVTPAKVYEALLDSKQFGAATGLSAEIDPKAG